VKHYLKLAAMIVTSMVAMYGLTYLNVYSIDHVYFSQTRLFMTLVMGSVMTVIMLGFMLRMYPNRAVNSAILSAAILVFCGALWLMRSQASVDDASYMRAMIPHHSIAILTSRNARISDPRVRELADGIIAAQEREIAEMKSLLDRLDQGE
jgi:hypothetical protein